VEGDQDNASPKYRGRNSLRHRRAKDRELEWVLNQSPLRQLEDQAEEIIELLKRWKEERGKTPQVLEGSRVKGVRKSARLKSWKL
jgi:hypothetical protein